MSEKKKLLILTPRFPYPVVGGDRLRIYHVCKQLSTRYQLTLLSLCDSEAELSMPLPDDGVFSGVERVYLPAWRSRLNAFFALFSGTPLQVAYYRSKSFARAVKRLLSQHDACLAHLIRSGDYLLGVQDKPIFLEMTDAISLNYQRVRALGEKKGLMPYVYAFEAPRLLAYERGVVRKFDCNVLVSETDRAFLLDGAERDNVLVCSNGVDTSTLPFASGRETSRLITFIGNMLTVQNMDACHYFASAVMPLVLQSFPDARFLVVGRISDANRQALEACPGVEVTGGVDSIPAAVRHAGVGVCPMRIGAGVQNKVLEYMSLGLPVITSSIGLEGFAAQPGKDLLVADDPQAYLAHLNQLWSDANFHRSLAINGRGYVEFNHDWAARLAPLVSRIDSILS